MFIFLAVPGIDVTIGLHPNTMAQKCQLVFSLLFYTSRIHYFSRPIPYAFCIQHVAVIVINLYFHIVVSPVTAALPNVSEILRYMERNRQSLNRKRKPWLSFPIICIVVRTENVNVTYDA